MNPIVVSQITQTRMYARVGVCMHAQTETPKRCSLYNSLAWNSTPPRDRSRRAFSSASFGWLLQIRVLFCCCLSAQSNVPSSVRPSSYHISDIWVVGICATTMVSFQPAVPYSSRPNVGRSDACGQANTLHICIIVVPHGGKQQIVHFSWWTVSCGRRMQEIWSHQVPLPG